MWRISSRVSLLGLAVGPLCALHCTMACAISRPTVLANPQVPATAGSDEPSIRYVRYSADHIYRLRGRVGYEIDLQFAPGERFIGLGVGDSKAIKVAAATDHLFIKPVVSRVSTDMTVLTNRRTYVFNYRVEPVGASASKSIVYAMRFQYPHAALRRSAAARRRQRLERALSRAEHAPPGNTDYWFCGSAALKPRAAWDDGAETHLVFPSREQLPAVFRLNSDGSESLVNFHMRGAQMVIQGIARRWVLKRGRLTGCIVNRSFAGSGRRLASGTISPRVWVVKRRVQTRRALDSGGGR